MSVKDKFKSGDLIKDKDGGEINNPWKRASCSWSRTWFIKDKDGGEINNPEDIWVVIGWVDNDPENGPGLLTRFAGKPDMLCHHDPELVEGMIKVGEV